MLQDIFMLLMREIIAGDSEQAMLMCKNYKPTADDIQNGTNALPIMYHMANEMIRYAKAGSEPSNFDMKKLIGDLLIGFGIQMSLDDLQGEMLKGATEKEWMQKLNSMFLTTLTTPEFAEIKLPPNVVPQDFMLKALGVTPIGLQLYNSKKQQRVLDNLSLGRKEGAEVRKKNAEPTLDYVKKVNSDLLARPVNEGWGSVKSRANFIAEKTGLSVSYVRRLIASPRKTKLA